MCLAKILLKVQKVASSQVEFFLHVTQLSIIYFSRSMKNKKSTRTNILSMQRAKKSKSSRTGIKIRIPWRKFGNKMLQNGFKLTFMELLQKAQGVRAVATRNPSLEQQQDPKKVKIQLRKDKGISNKNWLKMAMGMQKKASWCKFMRIKISNWRSNPSKIMTSLTTCKKNISRKQKIWI